MSAILGIGTRNGEPVRDEELRHLAQASASWGPDNAGVWSDGNAALGRAFTICWDEPRYHCPVDLP